MPSLPDKVSPFPILPDPSTAAHAALVAGSGIAMIAVSGSTTAMAMLTLASAASAYAVGRRSKRRVDDEIAATQQAKEEQLRLAFAGLEDRARAFDQLRKALHRLASTNDAAGLGKPGSPALASVAEDFNQVARSLSLVRATLGRVTATSTRLRQLCQNFASRSEDRPDLAAHLEALQKWVGEVGRADQLVGAIWQDLEHGRLMLERLLDALKEVAGSARTATDPASAIEDLALRLSLLALRSSNEAVNEGAAGTGVAALTADLRALAHDLADLAVQAKTQKGPQWAGLTECMQAAECAATALRQASNNMEQVGTIVGALSSTADMQLLGLQQVDWTLSEMQLVTQQNEATLAQALVTSRGLVTDVEELARTLGTGSDSPAAEVTILHRSPARTMRPLRAVSGSLAVAVAGAEQWADH